MCSSPLMSLEAWGSKKVVYIGEISPNNERRLKLKGSWNSMEKTGTLFLMQPPTTIRNNPSGHCPAMNDDAERMAKRWLGASTSTG